MINLVTFFLLLIYNFLQGNINKNFKLDQIKIKRYEILIEFIII